MNDDEGKKEPLDIGNLCAFFCVCFLFWLNFGIHVLRFACIRLALWIVSTNIDLTMIHNSHTDAKRLKLAVKMINKQIAQHITAAFYEYSFAEWEEIFNLFFILRRSCFILLGFNSFRFARTSFVLHQTDLQTHKTTANMQLN